MNEARLREVTAKVECLKTLNGKEFIKEIIHVTNDAQLTDLLAGHRAFAWLFDKIDSVCKSVPKDQRDQWIKEIQAEVGRAE